MNGMCVDDLEASRLVECPPRPVACPKVSTRMAPAGAPVERTYITFYLFFKAFDRVFSLYLAAQL